MSSCRNPHRLHYFDALRGLAIILVVLGHVVLNMGIGDVYDNVLTSIIYSFHLPLFFFISGYFAYSDSVKWNYICVLKTLKGKVQALVISSVVFYALLAFIYDSNIFSWIESGFGGYWFTIVLFQIFLVYLCLSLIAKCLHRAYLVDIGMISGSAISLGVLIFFRGDSQLWNVLCMENFCKYFQFFTLGILCRKYQDWFISLLTKDYFISGSIIAFVVCLVLYYHAGFKESGGVLYQAVHDIFVRYAGLLVVVGFFFSKRQYFAEDNKTSNLLQFIGRRTLDIYMLHYFFLTDLSFFKSYLGGGICS